MVMTARFIIYVKDNMAELNERETHAVVWNVPGLTDSIFTLNARVDSIYGSSTEIYRCR